MCDQIFPVYHVSESRGVAGARHRSRSSRTVLPLSIRGLNLLFPHSLVPVDLLGYFAPIGETSRGVQQGSNVMTGKPLVYSHLRTMLGETCLLAFSKPGLHKFSIIFFLQVHQISKKGLFSLKFSKYSTTKNPNYKALKAGFIQS